MRKTSQTATATEATRECGPTPDCAAQARILTAAELDRVAGAQKVREAIATTDGTAS
jgi:hypothetical protein